MSPRSSGLGSGHRSLGGRSSSRRGRTSYPSYRSRSLQAQHRRRRAAVVAVLVAVVVVVVAVRALTEAVPADTTASIAPADVSLPGTPPTPPWPASGQAAFSLPGVVTEASPAEAPVQIASVAKVMTAYVLLHDHPLAGGAPGVTYTVTGADVADYDARLAQAESIVPVVAGETVTEEQLLQGLLIPSGNNYADMIAEVDAGSIPAFVAKMNADAKALGMTQTTYTDPSGFASTTLSTAHDQAILASAVMASPTFAAIVATKSVNLPDAGIEANYDTLIGTDGFIGIKTGSDASAGGCFMFAATRTTGDTHLTVYGAVLGQDVGTDITDTLVAAAEGASQRIADTVPAGVRTATVLAAGASVVRVTNAAGASVDAVTSTGLGETGWAGTRVPMAVRLTPLGTSVRSGEVVAAVAVSGGQSSTVVTTAPLPAVGFGWRVEHIF